MPILLGLAACLSPALADVTPIANAASNASSVEKQLEGLRKVFRFGTYAQQVDALGRFTQALPLSNREAIVETFSLLENQLDNNDVLRRFMDVIENNKLARYYGMFEKSFLARDSRGDEARPDDLALMGESLRHLVSLSNAANLPLIESCFTNGVRNRKNPVIISEAFRGIEIHKPVWAREKIRELLRADDGNEFVMAAAVKALVAYKNEDDIALLAELVANGATPSLPRWNAVAYLGEYAPSDKAYQKLMAYLQQTDVDIRARSIYALGFFKNQNVRDLLAKSCKDNSARIRIFAVKGLAQWNDEETNELLQFKYKNDSEASVRAAAEKILRDRGLVKDEKKDEKK